MRNLDRRRLVGNFQTAPSKPGVKKTRGLGGLKHFAHERPSLRWEVVGAVPAGIFFGRIRGMEK